MPADPLLVRRLEALVTGRALPTHTHARVAVQPHALVIAAVALSGEDATLHAVALGWLGRPAAHVLAVADPRQRENQDEMFAWLGARLEHYHAWCDARATFPQLVVSSGAAVRHLTNIADDYRFLDRNAAVARLATLLTYSTERAQIAGQQAIVVMTEVLTTHWATPMQPAQEHHLGAVLACIDPPPGTDLIARIHAAEQVPMGATTDPGFDNLELRPLVTRYHRARAQARAEAGARPLAGDPPLENAAVRALRGEIEAAMRPVVLRIYDAVQTGLNVLGAANYPLLPAVAIWQRAEATAFTSFRRAVGAGVRFPLYDKAKAAAFRITQYEDAQANLDAAVEADDGFGRARGICLGQVLSGFLERHRLERRADRRSPAHVLDLVSTQDGLTVRERDEFHWADDPRLVAMVRDVRLDGGRTRITLVVTRGMNVPGVPSDGTAAAFVRAVPDWHRLGRQRGALADRLAVMPWTHVPGADAPHPGVRLPPPTDPLLRLEVFR